MDHCLQPFVFGEPSNPRAPAVTMRRPMPSVCRHVGPKAAAAQQRWFADCRPYCTLCQAFDSEDHRSPRTHKWQMQEWQQRAEGGALRASAMSLKGGEEPAALPHDRAVHRLLSPSERQQSRAAVERHDRLVPVGGIPTQRTVCVREHSTSSRSWQQRVRQPFCHQARRRLQKH